MKKINIMKYIALGLLSISVLSCNIDDDNVDLIPFTPGVVENPETISQLAIATPELSILEQALRILEERSDFKPLSALNIPGNTTVFAPTDSAFQAFLSANGIDGIENVPRDVLELIIKNHLLEGEFLSTALVNGYVKTNALNKDNDANIDLYINTSNGVLLNGTSTVTTADVDANNGVIHLVDTVITLPTVLELIAANSNFSSLVEAITLADAAIDPASNMETVSGFLGRLVSDFTVFAPSNAAFTSLLTELGVQSLSDIDPLVLRQVLLYHVLEEGVLSSDITTGTVESASNGDITIDSPNLTLTDERGRVSSIVTSLIDVQGQNGIVHEISTVLLPADSMPMMTPAP